MAAALVATTAPLAAQVGQDHETSHHDRLGSGLGSGAGAPDRGGGRGRGMFWRADANGDGRVDRREFEAARRARAEAHGRTFRPGSGRGERMFDMADANHDGVVSRVEGRAARERFRAMREKRMAAGGGVFGGSRGGFGRQGQASR